MTRVLSCALAVSLLSGCFTMTLRYEADVTRGGKTYEASYEETVGTAGYGTACALTGWLYGGSCWLFFLMPFQGQEEDFVRDARRHIAVKIPGKGRPRFSRPWVGRVGFNNRTDPQVEVAGLDTHEPKDETTHDDYAEPAPDEPSPLSQRIKAGMKERLTGATAGILAGTNYGPVGVGLAAGYRADPFKLEAGYGILTKNELLGRPFALMASYRIPYGLQLIASGSYYHGSGVRGVRYDSGFIYRTNATWTLVYGQVGLGIDAGVPTLDRVRFHTEAGIGKILSTRIKTPAQGEYSNLGDPVGMQIEKDTQQQGVAGRSDDYGPFVQLGVYFLLH